MSEAEFQIIKSAGFALALGLSLSLQALRPHAQLSGRFRENAWIWAISAVLLGLTCGACACLSARYAEAHGIGLLNWAGSGMAAALVVSVLGMDALSYAWHRANHTFPILWRFHQVHHSDPEFRATTALRFHPGELILALPVRLAGVALLGVPVEGLILFEVLFAFANFFEHGNTALPRALEGRLARVLITPALHRRHHSQQAALLDSNYGTIFSFWDRLFGSFGESSSRQTVEIGLPGFSGVPSLATMLRLPWGAMHRGR